MQKIEVPSALEMVKVAESSTLQNETLKMAVEKIEIAAKLGLRSTVIDYETSHMKRAAHPYIMEQLEKKGFKIQEEIYFRVIILW